MPLPSDGLVSLEDITCTICLDVFTSPRLLQCLHTFCLHCIQKHTATDNGKHVTSCPTCDHKTFNGDDVTTSLSTNSYIQRLANVYVLQTEAHRQCNVCKLRTLTTEATGICLDCNDDLCQACSGGHNSSSATALHRVVFLDDVRRGLYMQELIQAQTPLCAEHNAQCSLFCQTCDILVCTLCILPRHRDHELNIPDTAFDMKCASFQESMSKNSEFVSRRLQWAEARISELDLSEDAFERDILGKVDSVIDTISRERDTILEKGKVLFEAERERRRDALNGARLFHRRNEDLSELWLHISSSDKHGLLEMASVLEDKLQLLNKDGARQQLDVRMPFNITVNVQATGNLLTMDEVASGSQDYKEEQQRLSGLYVHTVGPIMGTGGDVVQASSSNSNCGTQDASVRPVEENTLEQAASSHDDTEVFPEHEASVPSSSKQGATSLLLTSSSCFPAVCNAFKGHTSNAVTNTRVSLKCTFSTKLRSESLLSEIVCLAVPTKDVCLVLDKANQKIKVHKTNGDQMYLVNIPDKCSMFGQFTVFGDYGSSIAAVFKNNLLILTRHLKLEKKIQLTSSEPLETDPIVSNFGDKYLIVGNLPDNEMRVYTAAGSFLRKWSSTVSGKIVSIKYAGGDWVVVCSWPKKGHVTIESETAGNILTVRGDLKNEVAWQPSDACVDSKKRIIVSDMRRNEISVFSIMGLPLTLISTQEYDIPRPSCLAVDNTGNLFVAFKGGNIAVFKLK